MSVMWSRPSMPSRSMNAPKSVRFLTVPLTVSPILIGLEEALALLGALLLDEFAAAESTTFFRSSLILTILKS